LKTLKDTSTIFFTFVALFSIFFIKFENKDIREMKLSILALEQSQSANLPKNAIPFRWVTHHVSEIYLHLLPKININNSSKIVLNFGNQGNEVAFNSMLGCTNIFIEDFDFEKFYCSSTRERELILIDAIKSNLVSIYKRNNNNPEDIQSIIATADKVIEIEFNLEIPIKKLEKVTKDRQKKMEIYRVLNAEVGEAWKCKIINPKDNSLLAEQWIDKIPSYLDRLDYFKKAEIKENYYVIYNNLGNVTFKIGV
jgi:hypothetical protein